MELRLPRKSMTAILSAMVVGTVICTSAFMTGDTQAVEDSAAYTQPAVKSMKASEEANEKENNALGEYVINHRIVITMVLYCFKFMFFVL